MADKGFVPQPEFEEVVITRVSRNRPLMEGQVFYPLTKEEWVEVIKALKPSEITVLFHLRTLSPYGEHYTPIGVRDLARTLDLDPSTVSRALKQLDRLSYIDLDLLQVNIRVRSKGALFARKYSSAQDPTKLEAPEEVEDLEPVKVEAAKAVQAVIAEVEAAEAVQAVIAEVEAAEAVQAVVAEVEAAEAVQAVVAEVEAAEAVQAVVAEVEATEAPTSQGFQTSKLNKITRKQKKEQKQKRAQEKAQAAEQQKASNGQSAGQGSVAAEVRAQASVLSGWAKFSAPGSDPEFFEFVVRRTAKLPRPPVDARCAAEGWIRKQGHLLYPQYLEWKAGQEQPAPQPIPQPRDLPPPPEAIPELTPEQRLAKYQAMWQAPVCRKGIKEAIAAYPEWGIQIGESGPEMVGNGTPAQPKQAAAPP